MSNINQNAGLATVGIVLCVTACTSFEPPPRLFSPQPPPASPQVSVPALPSQAVVGCASDVEMRAIKAAAIRQRLMVASYACHAPRSYGDFVKVYSAELRSSDFALQDFFDRINRGAGDRAYDTYKTRLANSAMLDSLANKEDYCASTKQTFSTAMSLPSRKLDLFLDTQNLPITKSVSPCDLASSGFGTGGVSLASDAQR